MPIKVTSDADGSVRLSLKVVPGASRDRIVGALGDALKVSVSKPPADGAANRAVVKLLAGALGVPPTDVSIVRGHSTPRKDVRVAGLSVEQLTSRLAPFADV
jgi:uncharacterized protein (TIGR00251 family)